MRRPGAFSLLLAALLPVGACAPAPPPAPPLVPAAAPMVEYLLVDKSERTLWAYSRGKIVRTYTGLQFGDAMFGHKQFEGDERTPEGRYVIDTRNPDSRYHLSLRISYPNPQDRAYAASRGRDPGGDIFLHGQPNGIASGRMQGDWTDGCIALANPEIAELYELVEDGTVIDIRP
ncbi:L,D-transpeptidase family protein [Erythrobacteraceae bacterium WH01K]|nr:L,D-transpeptidase family protein [Erythrobacteraceae bacterium WH01K]